MTQRVDRTVVNEEEQDLKRRKTHMKRCQEVMKRGIALHKLLIFYSVTMIGIDDVGCTFRYNV